MGIINKYTIWVVEQGEGLYEITHNKSNCQNLTLTISEGEIKDKFTKEEIDYLTSGFLTEADFVEYLSELSLFVRPDSHIVVTHQFKGMREDKPIYGNKYIHKFAKEVMNNKRKGKEKPYLLEDTVELHRFVENILNNCDIEFLLGCKKEIVSPKLMCLLSKYATLREDDTIQRDNIAGEIYKYCKNYDNVRKMVLVQQSLRDIRYVNKDEFSHLNATMYQELLAKPIENKRLQELYKKGGIEVVLKEMPAIDILSCTADDLRKVGILPYRFTVREYRAYQRIHPELTNKYGEMAPLEDIEEEPYSNTRGQQIDNPLLNNLYERYRGEDGEIDAEALFNDISIDDIYSNPENYEDLVAMGLIPESTKKEDVFGPSKK